MYGKKIIAAVAMVSVVTLSAAMFAAFEAHVVNVTAHIENALAVNTEAIEFGTVFPQEYLEKDFEIRLSDSFVDAFNNEDERRVQFVDYKIVSKPKCWNNDPENPEYAPVDFATHECPQGYEVMNDLCSFLSKMPIDNDADGRDIGVSSYFHNNECVGSPLDPIDIATGRLAACGNDFEDNWIVDLKVPPVKDYVGQDWPESCREWVVETDGLDYGCDLWVEVTKIYWN